MTDNYIGIDYGNGLANVDHVTGCRYGTIAINSLASWMWEELNAEYGEPTCPNCDGNVTDDSCSDYHCNECNEDYHSDECYPNEPLGYVFKDANYEAHSAFDNTVLFLTKSKYYTFTAFCSPCAPGAGNLDSPMNNGVKTLCFGHEMFEDGIAPYRVFNVEDNSEIIIT